MVSFKIKIFCNVEHFVGCTLNPKFLSRSHSDQNRHQIHYSTRNSIFFFFARKKAPMQSVESSSNKYCWPFTFIPQFSLNLMTMFRKGEFFRKSTTWKFINAWWHIYLLGYPYLALLKILSWYMIAHLSTKTIILTWTMLRSSAGSLEMIENHNNHCPMLLSNLCCKNLELLFFFTVIINLVQTSSTSYEDS